MNDKISGTVIVDLSFLDRTSAIIIAENLPIVLNNHPQQPLGTCKVLRDNNGRCIGELTFDNEVNGNLFFYYNSLNTEDGGFWFSGINLSEELYDDKKTLRLKEKLV